MGFSSPSLQAMPITKSDTLKRAAIEAFASNADVVAALGGKEYEPEQAALIFEEENGKKTYLVTQLIHVGPGEGDADVVAATVSFEGNKTEVELCEIVLKEKGLRSADPVLGELDAFELDPKVNKLVGDSLAGASDRLEIELTSSGPEEIEVFLYSRLVHPPKGPSKAVMAVLRADSAGYAVGLAELKPKKAKTKPLPVGP